MEEKSRISKLIDKTLKETSQLENNLNFSQLVKEVVCWINFNSKLIKTKGKLTIGEKNLKS